MILKNNIQKIKNNAEKKFFNFFESKINYEKIKKIDNFIEKNIPKNWFIKFLYIFSIIFIAFSICALIVFINTLSFIALINSILALFIWIITYNWAKSIK